MLTLTLPLMRFSALARLSQNGILFYAMSRLLSHPEYEMGSCVRTNTPRRPAGEACKSHRRRLMMLPSALAIIACYRTAYTPHLHWTWLSEWQCGAASPWPRVERPGYLGSPQTTSQVWGLHEHRPIGLAQRTGLVSEHELMVSRTLVDDREVAFADNQGHVSGRESTSTGIVM
ncbi:hypothetical protein F4780DRAFT_197903 [Xylariomycetidae sp. FL0641]|nr:hypothetical protein F4780DRAFT_197903 [Xylariomycetidae sp. FL0641]